MRCPDVTIARFCSQGLNPLALQRFCVYSSSSQKKKRAMRKTLCLLALILLTGACTDQTPDILSEEASVVPNGVVASPEHYQVEFENEFVRIIRVKYNPGDVSEMHSHWPLVGVSLTGGQGEFTGLDGSILVRPPMERGAVLADDGAPHSVRSILETAEEHIFVEPKQNYPYVDPGVPNAAEVLPVEVELEQFGVRALRLRSVPGQESPMHSHNAGVMIALTDAHFMHTLPSGEMVEAKLKAGQALWREAAVHSGKNIGTGPTELVLLELL